MAKAPRPGKVKTRLIPPLTAAEASAMGAAFLRDITENISAASALQPLDGHVAYAPAGCEELFDGLLAAGAGLLLADGDDDARPAGIGAMPASVQGFGRCLLHAARGLFARGYRSVCLLNADSPTLPTAVLAQAARALAGASGRVVLGPAEDGGYYLIGMTAPHAHLFADIAWSTDSVAAQTRSRVAELGLELVELPCWYDVDDQVSLSRLLAELANPASGADEPEPYAAPFTAACAARLSLADSRRPALAG